MTPDESRMRVLLVSNVKGNPAARPSVVDIDTAPCCVGAWRNGGLTGYNYELCSRFLLTSPFSPSPINSAYLLTNRESIPFHFRR